MTDTAQLLRLVHEIADPCEELRRHAVMIAEDASVPAELRQATADLGATVEHIFEIAHYILKTARPISKQGG
ncbi:hypothetical protein [Rhizobium wenxiniae]|uniref:hypothetical protein n=1 Tax=Rhizobium wenxiniae TaxID=1737357 RepID=UPI003C1A7B33